MRFGKALRLMSLLVGVGAPIILCHAALAATAGNAGAAQADNFLKNIINVMAGLGGTLATGFLVWGGIMYITSSGNLENLDKAKRIIKYSAIGLVIVIAAAAIVNFVSGSATDAFGK